MKGLWLVMDGRARFDVDEASILEAIHGVREQVPNKSVQHWKQHDAVLCFAEDTGAPTPSRPEYVKDVDAPMERTTKP